MDIVVEIQRSTYWVPTSQQDTLTDVGVVRFCGFSDLSLDGFLAMRLQQIFLLIPFAPDFVTIADLCALSRLKRDTIQTALKGFAHEGRIDSVRPVGHTDPGNVARRFWRVA